MALALGRTRGELMKTLDAREYDYWRMWEQLHGTLGPERLDRLAALVAWAGARSPKLRESDFVVQWDRRRPAVGLTLEQQMAVVDGCGGAGGLVSGRI